MSRLDKLIYHYYCYYYFVFMCIIKAMRSRETCARFAHSGDRFNIKVTSHRYRDSHHKDRTALRPSYLYHGNPHTWKDRLFIKTGPGVSCGLVCIDLPTSRLLHWCPWWRHHMETFSVLLALYEGNPQANSGLVLIGRLRTGKKMFWECRL